MNELESIDKWKEKKGQFRCVRILHSNSNINSNSDLVRKEVVVSHFSLVNMAADTEPKKIIIDTDPGIG